MRQIVYTHDSRGLYLTKDETSFGNDTHLKIIAEPHEYSIAISNEVLRSTAFPGCTAIVSCEGEVVFYDHENHVIGQADKGDTRFRKVILIWKQDSISIQFGHTAFIDNYPNCDGEHDRWDEKWVAQRTVIWNLKDNGVEIK